MPWGRSPKPTPRLSGVVGNSKAGWAASQDWRTPFLLTFWSTVAFEADEGARGAEGDEPVFVEGELSAWPQNWWRWGENQLGYLRIISVRPSLPPRRRAAEAVGGGSAAGAGDGGDNRDAIVESAGDQCGFAVRETPVTINFGLSMGRIGLQIIDDAQTPQAQQRRRPQS